MKPIGPRKTDISRSEEEDKTIEREAFSASYRKRELFLESLGVFGNFRASQASKFRAQPRRVIM